MWCDCVFVGHVWCVVCLRCVIVGGMHMCLDVVLSVYFCGGCVCGVYVLCVTVYLCGVCVCGVCDCVFEVFVWCV